MVTNTNKSYSLEDYEIVPAVVSDITSRSECLVNNDDQMLPLFTAPMGAVINEHNYQTFLNNNINTVIPRTVSYDIRLSLMTKTFVAFSLSEFENIIQTDEFENTVYICVDLANGHMKKLLEMCTYAKDKFGGTMLIMTGNIAHPDTYYEYAKAGIDYVRVGIGGGSACLTSVQSGVHYGQATLLIDTVNAKNKVISEFFGGNQLYKSIPEIIADGGMNSYSKIIKALAVGADYVMIGKLFAECDEACGEVYTEYKKNSKWTEEDKQHLLWDDNSGTYYVRLRLYYGMSSKMAQKEMGKTHLKTSEGTIGYVYVKQSLSGWVDNFVSYLQTAMSYTNSRNLEEFKQCTMQLSSVTERNNYLK